MTSRRAEMPRNIKNNKRMKGEKRNGYAWANVVMPRSTFKKMIQNKSGKIIFVMIRSLDRTASSTLNVLE